MWGNIPNQDLLVTSAETQETLDDLSALGLRHVGR